MQIARQTGFARKQRENAQGAHRDCKQRLQKSTIRHVIRIRIVSKSDSEDSACIRFQRVSLAVKTQLGFLKIALS
jgi:hypothetical protein